jgi:hypothetical protein
MLFKRWFLVGILVTQQLIAAHHPGYVFVDDTALPASKRSEKDEIASEKVTQSTVCSCFGFLHINTSLIDETEREYIEIAEPKTSNMPIAWRGRDDVFDDANALKYLLEKSKLLGSVSVINKTEEAVTVVVSGRNQLQEHSRTTFKISKGHYRCCNLSFYESIELEGSAHAFPNIFSLDDKIIFSIEPEPQLLFPRPLKPFSFIPRIPMPSDLEKGTEAARYFNHVGYLRSVLCPQEGINSDDLYMQRERLYSSNKLEALFSEPLPSAPRIEQNLFSVWLTNANNPKEPKEQYVNLAIKSAEMHSVSDGWNHYFVVQDPDLFPLTKAKLASTNVCLISYQDLIGSLELESEFNQSITECRFAMASDILRVELLKAKGGAYLDIDLVTLQSLKPLFYLYDSIFGIEPMSEFVGNAFMAASRDHPITNEMIRLMRRNFQYKHSNPTFYSAAAIDDGFNTIVQTGPGVSTTAFYNASSHGGKRDILMPPEMFYPAESLVRPEFRIKRLDSRIGINSATLHLWRTTWAGEAGKENGCLG